MKIFTVGIAEMKIAKLPDKLVTLGLGSCVGVVLYDSISRMGGMIHIMLPSAPKNAPVPNKSKFADTGIVELIRLMTLSGAVRSKMFAKVTGGAHMFNTSYNTNIMNVGKCNVDMCMKVLEENAIVVKSEDTGGNCGRSIEFCCETSMLQIRTVSPRSVRLI
ncbi:MAG: chemotaxis protein CheD [Eubacteriales bacterium]|nr:chemotaxis protein CheD [Eubacteriales bacterium]